MLKYFFVGIMCVGIFLVAEAKTTYRDSLGRKHGAAETDRYGKTTYCDVQGPIQGSKK